MPTDERGLYRVNAFPSQYGDLGMSLRDWFAGQALCSMVRYNSTPEHAAKTAYHIADAMIEARKEK